jgi:hypothetical protein
MADSPAHLTATVIFGYAWSIDEGTKQTLSYTKTYTNYPGSYSLYDVVRNAALPSASQFETVGIDFIMTAPGGHFTHPALATIATFRPTRPASQHGLGSHATATATAAASNTAVPEKAKIRLAEAQAPSRATNIIPSLVCRSGGVSGMVMPMVVFLVLLMIVGLVRSRNARQRSVQTEQPKC